MPKKRSEFEILRNRQKIAAMMLAGKKNIEIARELGISHQTVGRDIAAVTRLWQETHLTDVVNGKAVELERLNHIEAQLWEAWHTSKKVKTRIQQCSPPSIATEADPEPEPAQVSLVTENGHGAARYLQLIFQISQERSKLMGFYERIKLPINPNDDPAQMTKEERTRKAWEWLQKLRGAESKETGPAQSNADTSGTSGAALQ